MQGIAGRKKLTLHIGNALLENLLQNLGVLKLLLDLGNDGLGKLTLLALLNLVLVADPRVKDLLSLSGQSSALLELVGLSLKLGSLLRKKLISVVCFFKQCPLADRNLPWRQRTEPW